MSALVALSLAAFGCGDDEEPAPKPSITTFSAASAKVAPGATVVLTYAVKDAKQVKIDAAPGGVVMAPSATLNGTVTSQALSARTVFTLTATGDGGTATREVTVDIESASVTIELFSATPEMIEPGESSTLRYKVLNAESVTITANGADVLPSTTMLEGSEQVTPAATTTYTLEATGPGGQKTQTVTVRVSTAPVISSFSVTPMAIDPGAAAVLAWQVVRATSVVVTDGAGAELYDGAELVNAVNVSPAANTTYTLVATNAMNEIATRMVTLTVNPLMGARIVSFTAMPATIELGDAVVLAWVVEDAPDGIEISSGGSALHTSSVLTGTVSVTATVAGMTRYTLTAKNPQGDSTAMVTVNANADLPTIDSLVAAPANVVFGGRTEASWSTTGAASVELFLDGTSVFQGAGGSGSHWVTFTSTHAPALQLHAANRHGTTTRDLPVALFPLVLIESFSSNITGYVGTSTTITVMWSTSGAGTVALEVDGVADVSFPGGASGEHTLTVSGAAIVRLVASNPATEETAELEIRNFIGKDVSTSSTSPMVLAGDGIGVAGSISAPSEQDWFLVTVDAGQSLHAHTECGVDTIITIYDSNGEEVDRNDDGGGEYRLCSNVELADLAAGDYFVQVTGYSNLVGPYVLFVEVQDPACGNGIEERLSGETCDDGNVVSADGCSATCDFEGTIETEPNGSISDAETLTLPALVRGSLEAEDADWYELTIPEGASLEAQVTAPGIVGCNLDFQEPRPTLVLLAPDGVTELAASEPIPPIPGLPCGSIDPRASASAGSMAAGTYFLVVSAPGPLDSYFVHVRIIDPGCGNGYVDASEACDDGNTAPGDGCDATCQLEVGGLVIGPGSGEITFSASIQAPGEIDRYGVEMARAGHIRAETFAPSRPACVGADTVIAIRDGQGTQIAVDDEGGVASCSRVNGVHVLAGSYVVEVRAFGPVPSYELVIDTLEEGCGNGLVDTGEACDDGNAATGDGCDANCQVEGVDEVEPNDDPNAAQLISSGVYLGSVAGGADAVDFFAVDVPEGYNLDALATTGPLGACPVPADLNLELLAPDGSTVLATAGAAFPTPCPHLDPRTVPAARGLAAGRYYLAVRTIDELVPASQYFLTVNLLAPGCGNRVQEAGETCDDGNLVAGDGCDPSCLIELLGTYSYPTPGGRAVFSGAINVAGDRDFFRISLGADAFVRLETFTDENTASCAADTLVRLYDSLGAELGFDDDDGTGACSLISPSDAFARLIAGDYTVVVEDYGNNGVIASYDLVIQAFPANVCGNGVIEGAEECDDANAANGDGCSSTCAAEVDGVYSFPVPGGVQVFTSSIATVAQARSFLVQLATPAYLRAETFENAATRSCPTAIDTVIDVFQGGTRIGGADEGGVGHCSVYGPARLDAGTYLVRVSDYLDNGTIARFDLVLEAREADICGNGLLEPGEACDDGNTADGDGCQSDCSYEIAGTLSGATNTVQVDLTGGAFAVYALTVTDGQSVEAVTHAVGQPTACSAPTELELLGPTFESLVLSFGGGPAPCAAILVPEAPGATALAAGTYYLVVRGGPGASGLVEVDITLLDPGCGNGLVEAPESCDDGNLVSGDGCSTTCAFEGLVEVEPNDSTATANDSTLTGAGLVSIAGTLPGGSSDRDFFRLVVATNLNLVAHTYSQPGDPASVCPPGAGLDTAIGIYNSAGTRLDRNDDAGGGNYCSRVTRALTPGTYYVEVEYWQYPTPPAATQSYVLDIELD
ncbi:MAG: DVUA0089 family protein [Deltaproteobacteria bacterium]|nr:DVUA0089 family protein [Deltaproteobacteria bacterium]